ncbi:MAG: Gfo/Idh/MocA family oxidoreductase, partial [Clostridia bacterium]
MATFGWAIIGTGRIANTVAKEITATGRHKIVAVASRTLAKAEKFATKFNAAVYNNNHDAVLADGVDAVYIATPHSAHYPLILECIKYGKPILCEKSFTVNAKQAKIALQEAEKAGVYLSEAMWTRFNPVVRQVVEWVKNGEIGEIKSIKANFCLPLKLTKNFVSKRVYKAEYAGGALLDLGVYPIAYCHMLLGKPTSIETKTRIFDGVDYDDQITLTYKNAICKLNCSFDKLMT